MYFLQYTFFVHRHILSRQYVPLSGSFCVVAPSLELTILSISSFIETICSKAQKLFSMCSFTVIFSVALFSGCFFGWKLYVLIKVWTFFTVSFASRLMSSLFLARKFWKFSCDEMSSLFSFKCSGISMLPRTPLLFCLLPPGKKLLNNFYTNFQTIWFTWRTLCFDILVFSFVHCGLAKQVCKIYARWIHKKTYGLIRKYQSLIFNVFII